MIYLKSVLAGMAGALIGGLLWIAVAFVLPVWLPFIMSRMSGSSTGGVGAASIGSGSILLAAVVGFVAGFFWMFRAS